MPAPLPAALRERFVSLLEEGMSGRAAALRLKLSPATGSRWSHAYRTTGRIDPAPQGRAKGSGKLAPYHDFFRELIAHDGDITLCELRDALLDAHGMKAHISSIDALLRRLGFRFKKSRWWPPSGSGSM